MSYYPISDVTSTIFKYRLITAERGYVTNNNPSPLDHADVPPLTKEGEGTLKTLVQDMCQSETIDPQTVTLKIESEGFENSCWRICCCLCSLGCFSNLLEGRFAEMQTERFKATLTCLIDDKPYTISRQNVLIDQVTRSILGRQGTLQDRQNCSTSLSSSKIMQFSFEKIESSHQE